MEVQVSDLLRDVRLKEQKMLFRSIENLYVACEITYCNQGFVLREAGTTASDVEHVRHMFSDVNRGYTQQIPCFSLKQDCFIHITHEDGIESAIDDERIAIFLECILCLVHFDASLCMLWALLSDLLDIKDDFCALRQQDIAAYLKQ